MKCSYVDIIMKIISEYVKKQETTALGFKQKKKSRSEKMIVK